MAFRCPHLSAKPLLCNRSWDLAQDSLLDSATNHTDSFRHVCSRADMRGVDWLESRSFRWKNGGKKKFDTIFLFLMALPLAVIFRFCCGGCHV